MKRILMILDNYYPHIGGAEKLFQNLAESLAQSGYAVTVFTPKSYPEYLDEEVHNGVRIIRQKVPAFAQRHFFTFLSIPRAVQLAKEHDLIHTAIYNSVFPAWVAAKIARKKVVVTIYEVWRKNWFKFGDNKVLAAIFFVLEWLMLSLKFDKHICISESTMHDYRKLYPNRETVRIYPGVSYEDLTVVPKLTHELRAEVRRKLGISPTDFMIFGFGRTGLSKGFEYLVDAVPKVVASLPNAKFVFIWPSAHNFVTMRDRLIERLQQVALADIYQVHDKKSWPELITLIQAADCVMVPSLSEGFGYVVVESCCLAERVIASNTTSIPEVVGGNYRLSEPGNSASIAEGIVKIANNDFLCKPLPTKFTNERMTCEHLNLYESI